MHVSPDIVFPHTHIPRDACFPVHTSLMHFILQVIVICVSAGSYFVTTPTLLFELLSMQILMQIGTVARTRARSLLS